MPGWRALAIAAAVGVGVAAYFQVWIHWPTPFAVAIGATMAITLLLIAASFGDDSTAADAAWRDAAPDLVRTPGTPAPHEPVATGEPSDVVPPRT
jgi:hypothetical protein